MNHMGDERGDVRQTPRKSTGLQRQTSKSFTPQNWDPKRNGWNSLPAYDILK